MTRKLYSYADALKVLQEKDVHLHFASLPQGRHQRPVQT